MNIRGYGLSKVNGPGNRFVLWTQGCSKGCSECFNPETWSTNVYKELSYIVRGRIFFDIIGRTSKLLPRTKIVIPEYFLFVAYSNIMKDKSFIIL